MSDIFEKVTDLDWVKKIDKDKIDLRHQRFSFNLYQNDKIYYSEIVDSGLWGENLFSVMPHRFGVNFLPNKFFMELHAIPIPANFAERLFQNDVQHSFFCPGVDIDLRFVDLINQSMGTAPTEPKHLDGAPHRHNSTIWGGWSFLKAIQFDSLQIGRAHV